MKSYTWELESNGLDIRSFMMGSSHKAFFFVSQESCFDFLLNSSLQVTLAVAY